MPVQEGMERATRKRNVVYVLNRGIDDVQNEIEQKQAQGPMKLKGNQGRQSSIASLSAGTRCLSRSKSAKRLQSAVLTLSC